MPLIRRRWTDEDLTNLRSMAGKYSTDQIARRLDRGRPAVTLKAHELGVSLRVARSGRPLETGVDPGPAGMDLTSWQTN
jgi:hypothetical protein